MDEPSADNPTSLSAVAAVAPDDAAAQRGAADGGSSGSVPGAPNAAAPPLTC
jgi:hypothetical protein